MAGQGRRFTKEEIVFLEKNYKKMHYKEIAETLKRHPKTVHRKMLSLDLKPGGANNAWTAEEIEFLKTNLTDLKSIEKIATALGRSNQAVYYRAYKQRFNIKDFKTSWTREELNFLEDSWGVHKTEAIAKKLNRTDTAIAIKAYKMGLGKKVGNGYCVDDIHQILGVGRSTVSSWIRKGLLTAKKNKTTKHGTYVVTEANFKKFLFEHQELWDTRRWTANIFMKNGENPAWLEKKLEDDKKKPARNKTAYSKKEDDTILKLFFEGKSCVEIAAILGRTQKSVEIRLSRINYKNKEKRNEKTF